MKKGLYLVTCKDFEKSLEEANVCDKKLEELKATG